MMLSEMTFGMVTARNKSTSVQTDKTTHELPVSILSERGVMVNVLCRLTDRVELHRACDHEIAWGCWHDTFYGCSAAGVPAKRAPWAHYRCQLQRIVSSHPACDLISPKVKHKFCLGHPLLGFFAASSSCWLQARLSHSSGSQR